MRLRFVRGALDKFPECEIGKTDTCNEAHSFEDRHRRPQAHLFCGMCAARAKRAMRCHQCQSKQLFMAACRTRHLWTGVNTTLADLLTLPLVANPFSAVRASLRL